MKRKELLAKSLAVGLAVAMAASSMSTPGGLLAPVTVMAEDETQGTLAKEDFSIAGVFLLPDGGIDVKEQVKCSKAITEANLSVKVTDSKSAEVADGKITEAGSYKVSVSYTADETGGFAALDETELATVTVYGKVAANTLKYKVGADGTASTAKPTGKKINEDVTISVDSGAIAKSDTLEGIPAAAGSMGSGTEITIAKPADAEETTSVYVLVKDGDTVTVEEVAIDFDTKKPVFTVEESGKTASGITLTVKETFAEGQDTTKSTYEMTSLKKKAEGSEEITPKPTASNGIFTLTDLDEGTAYTYEITASDAAENEATQSGEFTTSEKQGATKDDFTVKKTVLMASELSGNVEKKADSAYNNTVAYKYSADESGTELKDTVTESGKYYAFATAAETSDCKAISVNLGAVSVYTESAATLKFTKEGSDTAVEQSALATTKFNKTVTVSSDAGTVAVVSALPEYSEDVVAGNATIAAPTSDKDETVIVLVKGSDSKISAKEVTLKFDVTAPTLTVNQSAKGKDSASLKVTASEALDGDAEVKATKQGDSTEVTATGSGDTYTFSGLEANATYNYTVTASDAAGNPATATGTFATAEFDAFTTEPTLKKGGSALSGAPKVGDELTVDAGSATDVTYQWVSTKNGTPTDVGTDAGYTVKPTDVGAALSVRVTGKESDQSKETTLFTDAVEMKECAISFAANDVFTSENTVFDGTGAARKWAITVPAAVTSAGGALEYSLDSGNTWTDLSGTSIPVGASEYAANQIQVRVKEDAASGTKAGAAVSYSGTIAADQTSGTDTPGGDNTGGSGSGSGSSSGSSSGSPGSSGSETPSGTKPTTETKPDGTTVTTTEETKPDGTTVTTTEEKKPDGSTKTEVEEKKPDGSATTTTQEKKADGTTVNGVEEKKPDGSSVAKISVENKDTGVQATVSVTRDTAEKVTDAKADVTQVVPDKTAKISAAVVSQIAESAGTKDVVVTEKVVGANGKTVCKITVNLSDLTAGNDMKVLKINKKTGELSLINKSTYTVAPDGSIALSDLKTANYMLVTGEEADAFSAQVLGTVKVEKSKKSVTAGKKMKIALSDELNMDNVAKVTYTSSKKSVATVSKNGTVKTKKAGKVTVKAKVTLKNGKTKTVKMTITVKKQK